MTFGHRIRAHDFAGLEPLLQQPKVVRKLRREIVAADLRRECADLAERWILRPLDHDLRAAAAGGVGIADHRAMLLHLLPEVIVDRLLDLALGLADRDRLAHEHPAARLALLPSEMQALEDVRHSDPQDVRDRKRCAKSMLRVAYSNDTEQGEVEYVARNPRPDPGRRPRSGQNPRSLRDLADPHQPHHTRRRAFAARADDAAHRARHGDLRRAESDAEPPQEIRKRIAIFRSNPTNGHE